MTTTRIWWVAAGLVVMTWACDAGDEPRQGADTDTVPGSDEDAPPNPDSEVAPDGDAAPDSFPGSDEDAPPDSEIAPETSFDGDTSEVEDPVPAACDDVPAPAPFAKREPIGQRITFGVCGDLAVVGSALGCSYWDGAFARRTEVATPDLAIAQTSRAVVWIGPDNTLVGEDLASGATLEGGRANFLEHFGFVRIGARLELWGCFDGAVDVGGRTVMTGVDCGGTFLHELSGLGLATDAASGELIALDLATGEQRATGALHGRTASGDRASSAMRWAADGRVALVQTVTYVDCGDTQCRDDDTGVVPIDVGTGRVLGRLGGDLMPSPIDEPSVFTSARGHVVVGVDARSRRIDYLRHDLAIDVLEGGAAPVVLSAAGDFVYATRATPDDDAHGDALVRVTTATGIVHPIVDDAEAIVLSDDGEVALVAHFTDRCIRTPDGNCGPGQIWSVGRWRAASGLELVSDATQPITALWVGDDGSALVSGRLFDGPAPVGSESPLDPPWRTVLYAPDGAVRASWEASVDDVWAADGTLFFQAFVDDVLRAVTTSTGAEAVVATGTLATVRFDRRRQRVAMTIYNGDGNLEVWAGAIPHP